MLYETYKYSEALKTVAPKRISNKVPQKLLTYIEEVHL